MNFISAILLLVLSASLFNEREQRINLHKMFILITVIAIFLDIIFPFLFHVSLFANPNIKVGFLIFVIPHFIYEIEQQYNNKHKTALLLYFIGIIVIFALFLSARSHWGNLILMFSITTYLFKQKKINKIHLAITSIIFCIIIFKYISLLPTEISQRFAWFEAAMKMILEKPITGFGPGSAAHLLPAFTSGTFNSIYAHSYFLEFAAENGIITFIAFISFLIFSLKKLSLSREKLDIAVFSSIFGLLLYNIAEYNISIPYINIMLWISIGTYGRLNEHRNAQLNISKKSIWIPILMLAIFLFSKPLISQVYFKRGIKYFKYFNPEKSKEMFKKSLKIFPRYKLPKLGLATLNIFENKLYMAYENTGKSLAVDFGTFPYQRYIEGQKLLSEGNNKEARAKLWEVIRIRYRQHGLDPDYYMFPNIEQKD